MIAPLNMEAYRPKLTVGITSYNRFLYLRSLMTSLEKLDRRQFQFIVVDNGSTEKEIRPYLEELLSSRQICLLRCITPEERNWVNDEYIAKNFIIDNAKSEVILFLQDDLQFISTQDELLDTVASFLATKVPCCEMNAVRNTTIKRHYAPERDFMSPTHNIRFWAPTNNHFHTMGLFRTDIFMKFGHYPVDWPQTQEFWGRSEDWYDAMLKSQMPGKILNISTWVPHFAPVWNDPRGGYAFIRGNRRYGHYLPAGPTGEYYEHYNKMKFLRLQAHSHIPCSFCEVAVPIGWSYAIDQHGDQVKFPQSQAMIDGPWEDL